MNPLMAAQDIIHSVFLYAAFTDRGFVKVGISRVPYERVAVVHMNSPFPVEAAMWAWVGNLHAGRAIEREIKSLWKERNTRGEWYEFDYAADKGVFHKGINQAFQNHCRHTADWTRHNADEVKEMVRNKAKWEAGAKQRQRQGLTGFRKKV